MSTIFPDEMDHGYHLAANRPHVNCEECRYLQRYPVLQVGYLIQQPDGKWLIPGWQFDTAAPDSYPWLINDMVLMAQQEQEIRNLPEYRPEGET